jgi:hypothetical protein
MTEKINPQVTGSQGSATGQAGAAAVQGSAGGNAGTAGYTTQGFQGTMKQTSDVNTEEALSVLQALNPKMAQFFSDLLSLNAKRTADQAQSTDLAAQLGDSAQRLTLNNLATQALQNAIETANMVSKQAVRHSDLAIDRQWNLNETDYAGVEALRGNTFKDAIAGAVASAVAQVVSTQK